MKKIVMIVIFCIRGKKAEKQKKSDSHDKIQIKKKTDNFRFRGNCNVDVRRTNEMLKYLNHFQHKRTFEKTFS